MLRPRKYKYFEIQISRKIINLCKVQKEFCNENKIKITRKITELEYTKMIEFIARVCTRLSSII